MTFKWVASKFICLCGSFYLSVMDFSTWNVVIGNVLAILIFLKKRAALAARPVSLDKLGYRRFPGWVTECSSSFLWQLIQHYLHLHCCETFTTEPISILVLCQSLRLPLYPKRECMPLTGLLVIGLRGFVFAFLAITVQTHDTHPIHFFNLNFLLTV